MILPRCSTASSCRDHGWPQMTPTHLMRSRYTSDVRTTVDIDSSVLEQLRKLQQRRSTSLGALMSELLARALADEDPGATAGPLSWSSASMGARIDLEDRDAVLDLLDDDR